MGNRERWLCLPQLMKNISKALILFPDENGIILFLDLIDNIQLYGKSKQNI